MNPMNERNLIDNALTLGATARLTRLVTADDWGMWFIRVPVYDAIQRHTQEGNARNVAHAYAEGLTCPHCVGFWIGVGVMTVDAATRGTRLARPWRFVKAALTLNAVMVPLGRSVDYWSTEP